MVKGQEGCDRSHLLPAGCSHIESFRSHYLAVQNHRVEAVRCMHNAKQRDALHHIVLALEGRLLALGDGHATASFATVCDLALLQEAWCQNRHHREEIHSLKESLNGHSTVIGSGQPVHGSIGDPHDAERLISELLVLSHSLCIGGIGVEHHSRLGRLQGLVAVMKSLV